MLNNLEEQERQRLLTSLELLKVPQLKALCRSTNLPVSGKKLNLQERLKDFFSHLLRENDVMLRSNILCTKYILDKVWSTEDLPAFEELRFAQYNERPLDSVTGKKQNKKVTITKQTITEVVPSQYTNTLNFVESPFYKLEKLVPESAQKVFVTTGRGSRSIKFKLSASDFNLLQNDKNCKLYLFCGMVNPLGSRGKEVIQFPSPNEIKLNNEVIKDNVKGIKNKLGTAKPADLTPYLSRDNRQNQFEFVYAFTVNEYLLYIYMVKLIQPETILEQILQHPKILKAATIYYLKQTLKEDNDEEIMTTSTIMSLMCPISYTRMRYPAKSIMCKHLQCFDALWYVHSQMQVPTWQCPVCQVSVKIEQLSICEYVEEILKDCDKDVEQVELSEDGSWKALYDEEAMGNDTSSTENEMEVKKEESADQNVATLTSAKGSTSKKDNEPIIISLDSDDEDEGHVSMELGGGTYVDNRDSRNTLDPNINQNTPTAKLCNAINPDKSSNYLDRHSTRLPSLLGKEPLNTWNSTPLRDRGFTTIDSSLINDHTTFPEYLKTNPFLADQNVNTSLSKDGEEFIDANVEVNDNISRSSSLLTVLLTKPGAEFNNSNSENIKEVTTGPISTNVNSDSNILDRLDYNDSIDSTNRSSTETTDINNPFLERSQYKNGLDEDIVAPTVNSNSDIVNVPNLPQIPVIPSVPSIPLRSVPQSYNIENRSLPQLPRLPNIINRNIYNTNTNRLESINKGLHSPNPSMFIPPFVSNTTTMKPIVAPFRPRKDYVNNLPQKRQLSDSSLTKSTTSNTNSNI